MKKTKKLLSIIVLVFVISTNLLIVGCSTSIFNSDKSYYQTVKCVNGRPEVHIYYGKEFSYVKMEPLENSSGSCNGTTESNTSK